MAREYEKRLRRGSAIAVRRLADVGRQHRKSPSKRGDLYIPADDFYVHLAEQKNLIDEVIPLAEMTPVIAVPKGNPKQIRTLEQLLSGQYRVSQANPDAAANRQGDARRLVRPAMGDAPEGQSASPRRP